jgi:hypothetical protein
MSGQRAQLIVNDIQTAELDFNRDSFAEPGIITCALLLRCGQNTLEFQFVEASRQDNDSRELVLLLEALETGSLGDLTETQGPPPSATVKSVVDGPATDVWECDEGFSFKEGPYPDQGLEQSFYWALGKRSTGRIHIAIAGLRTLRLKLRNYFPEQVIQLLLDGALLSETLLPADFATPTVLEIKAEFSSGWHVLEIQPSQWERGASAERALSVLFESVSLEAANSAEDVSDVADGAWSTKHGFRPEEGPYPDLELPNAFRWSIGPRSEFSLFSASAGQRRLTLTLRNFHPDQEVVFEDGIGTELARVTLPATSLGVPAMLTADLPMQAGWNHLVLIPRSWSQADEEINRLGVILEELCVHSD